MMEDYSDVDILRDHRGHPLRLFHGTTSGFTRFSMDSLRSAGTHFGCVEQANPFVGRDEGIGRQSVPGIPPESRLSHTMEDDETPTL